MHRLDFYQGETEWHKKSCLKNLALFAWHKLCSIIFYDKIKPADDNPAEPLISHQNKGENFHE